ncbi:MAG: ABC transporter ATP-binding protein [Burkholderiales bacterium]|nr:ABC transporter ATP-binding protein [Burkholderiales bacterium]
MSAPSDTAPLLEIRGLVTQFRTRAGVARAVDGVSFSVAAGETLALVGESGCGKSVTSFSVLRLIASPPGEIAAGEVRFQGRDLRTLPESAMRAVRGNDIAMIFQEPMTSLNPVFTIGDQIAEAVRAHRPVSKREATERAVALLAQVRIPEPAKRAAEYPHRLSGGMRQRAMIAMALACEPKLLIADEPTTALDVTIQAQILDLIDELKARTGMGVLLITHDLGVVAQHAQRVAVMYAGRIVEQAPTADLFASPQHPYTRGLLASIPRPGSRIARLVEIPGLVPALTDMPAGCAFAPRCPRAQSGCSVRVPTLEPIDASRQVACLRAREPDPVAEPVDG